MSNARASYNYYNSPNIYNDKEGTCVIHNHAKTIEYGDYTFRERRKLRNLIDEQSIKIVGCLTFFKTASEKLTDPLLAAHAAAAAKEDEARLADFKKHRPWC